VYCSRLTLVLYSSMIMRKYFCYLLYLCFLLFPLHLTPKFTPEATRQRPSAWVWPPWCQSQLSHHSFVPTCCSLIYLTLYTAKRLRFRYFIVATTSEVLLHLCFNNDKLLTCVILFEKGLKQQFFFVPLYTSRFHWQDWFSRAESFSFSCSLFYHREIQSGALFTGDILQPEQ